MLTDHQKKDILALRRSGLGYGTIAQRLGLTKNTVAGACRKCKDYIVQLALLPSSDSLHCRHCGAPIKCTPGKRARLYCSDACRRAWWKEHQEQSKPRERSLHSVSCQNCGRMFTVWGQRKGKYCSHRCYIEARYGSKP